MNFLSLIEKNYLLFYNIKNHWKKREKIHIEKSDI